MAKTLPTAEEDKNAQLLARIYELILSWPAQTPLVEDQNFVDDDSSADASLTDYKSLVGDQIFAETVSAPTPNSKTSRKDCNHE